MWHSRALRSFEKASSDVEILQRKAFDRLMRVQNDKGYALPRFARYEDVPDDLPMAEFSTQASLLEKFWQGDSGVVWQPTSGSTGGRKWVPYTSEYRADTQRVASIWLDDLGRRYPGILNGTHYWSLSWLPDELRERGDNDDSRFLPWWQRKVLKSIFAVPTEIQNLATLDETWFATLIYLANDETVSLMSVWSPTFALRLLDDLRERRDEIVRDGASFLAARGLPPARIRRTPLPAKDENFFRLLWPRLALISSWDSATSTIWSEKLRCRLPWVPFQGKGLWATEGPVTIPVDDRKVLCASSHFFEFRRFSTGEVVPAWRLVEGEEVQPLLWSSNGIRRMPLQDRIRVSGFFNTVPCLEFLSRLGSTDLVGEKVDAFEANRILEDARHDHVEAVGIFAVKNERRYVMAVIGTSLDDAWLEGRLNTNHHYVLARELGQLRHAQIRSFESYDAIESAQTTAGLVRGQIKIEALRAVESLGEEKPESLSPEMRQTNDY